MRRCIKWLINWFTNWVGKMNWIEKASFALGGIAGIAVGILIFISIDKISIVDNPF